MDHLITGAQLFFGSGLSKKMDILIQDRTIIAIQPVIKVKSWMKHTDATGYIAFPGLISQAAFAKYVRNSSKYEKQMLHLLNLGYTSIIDVIRWDHNYPIDALVSKYVQLHQASPLDYSFILSIPIDQLTPSRIKEASNHHIRQIIIDINHVGQFNELDWDLIFVFSKKYGVSMKLCPHTSFSESKKGKKRLAELTNYWYYLNIKYGRMSLFVHSAQFAARQTIEFVSFSESMIKDCVLLPAKSAGIFPQKGSIALGSDADLVFVSMDLLQKQMQLIPHFIILHGQILLTPIMKLPPITGVQLHTVRSGTLTEGYYSDRPQLYRP